MNPSFFMIWTPQSMDLLEFVKSSQHTSSSNTTENVGSSSLHQRHESLVLHDLDSAVNGSLVLDSTTGGHHHTSSDGINGVGHKSSSDGNSPSKKEGKGSSSSSGENVGSELPGSAGILGSGEGSLDSILEGKVKSLSWEVSEHISQVSSPEGVNSLSLEDSGGTVNDTSVWLVKTTLLDHLILVLDKELDSLNGSSSSLRDSSSNTSKHKILNESELLLVTHYEALMLVLVLL